LDLRYATGLSSGYGPAIPFSLGVQRGRDGSGISGALNQGRWQGGTGVHLLSLCRRSIPVVHSEVSMPGSGLASFDFPSGGNNSYVNYKRNTWLEKVLQSGSLVGVRLHEKDGLIWHMAIVPTKYLQTVLLSRLLRSAGHNVTFSYTSGCCPPFLADSTAFQLYYNDFKRLHPYYLRHQHPQ